MNEQIHFYQSGEEEECTSEERRTNVPAATPEESTEQVLSPQTLRTAWSEWLAKLYGWEWFWTATFRDVSWTKDGAPTFSYVVGKMETLCRILTDKGTIFCVVESGTSTGRRHLHGLFVGLREDLSLALTQLDVGWFNISAVRSTAAVKYVTKYVTKEDGEWRLIPFKGLTDLSSVVPQEESPS